jgi:hypothetical protein
MVFLYIFAYVVIMLLTLVSFNFVLHYFDLGYGEEIPTSILVGVAWPIGVPIALVILFAMFCNSKIENLVTKLKEYR